MNLNKPFLETDEREIVNSILLSNAERKKAEDSLFKRYAYFIQEAVRKHGLTREEASDVYCDTIISAIDKIADGSFEGRSSLKTWLFQIFHNKYVDLLRKKSTNKNSVHRTVSVTDMLFHLSDSSKTIIQELTDRTDWDVLKQKLGQLGDVCRKMLLLWADGHSDKEIAGTMDYKTADVVKTSRLRCLGKLKQLYRTR